MRIPLLQKKKKKKKKKVLTRIQSCEKIRVALEDFEVDKDIAIFIKERGTGGDIPEPPKFINFSRGDDEDDAISESSEEGGYSEAQYQRAINPSHRSSSPQPSTYESHHDPQSELALRMGHGNPSTITSSRDGPPRPPKLPNSPFNARRGNQGIDVRHVQSNTCHPYDQLPENATVTGKQASSMDLRRGSHLPPNYDPSQHGEITDVPHNAYPTDGMTMFCRTGPPSERSSATSYRPSSRGSQGEISNPTSVSSQEAVKSPTKPVDGAAQQVQKKRSAFFSNSPFRRKSRHEKDRQATDSANSIQAPHPRRPTFNEDAMKEAAEMADPRANFQLNVGNNVFDVASPDASTTRKPVPAGQAASKELDPIARALADLKGTGKQSSSRVSADRYHGIATPTPLATPSPANFGATSTATPPPAYNDPSVKRLDAPQPAFTASQMQKTTQKYAAGQPQNVRSRSPFARRSASPQVSSPRVASPQVSAAQGSSPQLTPVSDRGMGQYSTSASRSQSPYQASSMRNRYSQSPTTGPGYSNYDYSRMSSPQVASRNASPQPQFRQPARPSSASVMERQASIQPDPYGPGYDSFRGQPNGGNTPPYYPDAGGQGARARSRTLALADPTRQYSRDGRPVLHYGKF